MHLLVMSVLALVAPSVHGAVSTYTEEFCYTAFGPSSISSIPTIHDSRTDYFTLTHKTTKTPTQTVTLSPVKTTTTRYTTTTIQTTISQSAAPVTVTSTISNTRTKQTTIIAFNTTTQTLITTVDSTTTVPTSSGFTPISPYLAALGGTSYQPAKRAITPAMSAAQSTPIQHIDRHGGNNTAKFPNKVTCKTYVQIISIVTSTKSGSNTKTVTSTAATSTLITTSTIRTTSTSRVVAALTTITSFITSATTITVTSTKTSTLTTNTATTVFGPIATTYAACASDNFVSAIYDQQYGYAIIDSYYEYGYQPGKYEPFYYNLTVSDCCSQCQSQGINCSSFAWSPPDEDFNASYCSFLLPNPDGTCDVDYTAGGFVTFTNENNPPITFGYSGCGLVVYRGPYEGS